eukprot:g4080.t1
MAVETLAVRCMTDNSWHELDSTLSRVEVESGKGSFIARYWWNGRQHRQKMSLIDMRQNIRISPKVITKTAAKNLKTGASILGRANFGNGCSKWYDCQVVKEPIVSGKEGVCIHVQWNVGQYQSIARQINNTCLYTDFHSVRILNPNEVLTNEQFRQWFDELAKIAPAVSVVPSSGVRNPIQTTPVIRGVVPRLNAAAPVRPSFAQTRNIGGKNIPEMTQNRTLLQPRLHRLSMELRNPYWLPARPRTTNLQIPRTLLSQSVNGSRTVEIGYPALIRRDFTPVSMPPPVRPPPMPNKQAKSIPSSVRRPVIEPPPKKKQRMEVKSRPIAKKDQVMKMSKLKVDRKMTFKDLNKFGILLLALAHKKPGFDEKKWIAEQKGTLAVSPSNLASTST